MENHMPKRIFIVDDNLTIREMLRYALVIQGFDVVEAVDGADALEKIVAHDVDLIIIDWHLPKMDGLELLQRIRKMAEYAGIPVLMVSCRDDIEARRRARELGAFNWLKKPFRISELQMIVENGLCDTELRRDQLIDKAANGRS
jgi:two-component system chemotaxis response regulator CheY